MGNNASRNETRNARSARKELTEKKSKRGAAAVDNDELITRGEDVLDKQATTAPHQVSNSAGLTAAAGKRSPVEVQQQQQTSYLQRQQREQRSRQQSNWSFGSLSGRLNWSFTGGASNSKSSFRHRNKSALRKSFNSIQQKRSKTSWHRPLTNAIFSSHFKETSRNEQFHIDSLIAKGAFGVVFKVIDKQSQQLERNIGVYQHINAYNSREHQQVYALKVLKKSKIISDNSVQQLKDEADIQKLCGHHPFIVRQFDLWQNRRNLHILSEFVPNGELFSKIAAFSLDLIRLYVAEIALAIDFLHNAGIIYRDAKPENILLNETFHIKLTDFGLSKWLKLGSTTKTMCGTFQYMGTIHELN